MFRFRQRQSNDDRLLLNATRHGNKAEVLRLLAKGANVNAIDKRRWTPLHYGSMNGHADVAEILIAKGADINAKNNVGSTPLHHACRNGHVDMVGLLLDKRADVNAKRNDGWTPLAVAKSRRHDPTIKLLEDFCADPNGPSRMLLDAARHGTKAEVLRLLAKGTNVEAKDNDGLTPLHRACMNGHAGMAEMLLAKGANANARSNSGRTTPLHYACRNGHANVVEMLLAKGADVNAKDSGGRTPLHDAKSSGHDSVIKLLDPSSAKHKVQSIRWYANESAGGKISAISVGTGVSNLPTHSSRVTFTDEDRSGYKSDIPKTNGNAGGKISAISVGTGVSNLPTHSSHVMFTNEEQSGYKSDIPKTNGNVGGKVSAISVGTGVPNLLPNPSHVTFTHEGHSGNKSDIPKTNGNVGGKISAISVGTGVPNLLPNPSHVIFTGEDHSVYESDNPKTPAVQLNITDDDYLFLKMGRELVRDGSVIPVISANERSALRTLATNMADFERSLKSVQGLPPSLADRDPRIADYYFFFTSAFERTYVATQVIVTGAVTMELNNMSTGMLEELLGKASWFAELSQLPFVGCVSIFSTIINYQRRTKKKNTFIAFEQFFRGNCRDQYLLTYQELAEQISLRIDTSSFTKEDSGTMGNLREQVKKNIIEPIRKHLRKVHLDTIEKLNAVEQMAMADLALITMEVLRLHQEDQDTYDKLCASDEFAKASYFIGHLFDMSSYPDQKSPNNCSMQTNSRKSFAHESLAHTKNVESAELEYLTKKIQNLEEDNKRLQKHTDVNANMAQELRQMQVQVRKLASKVKSEKDVTYSYGGQAQVQINPNKPKEEEMQQLEDRVKILEQLDKDFLQMQIQQEKLSREVKKINLENFINNRVLTCHEAFEYTRKILSMAEIAVSEDGNFVHNGKDCCIGEVRTGSLIPKKKTLWKGRIDVKLEEEHQGVKSIMEWFDKSKLRPLYERNEKGAICIMFPGELEEPCLTDMTQPHQCLNQQDIRNKLFGANHV